MENRSFLNQSLYNAKIEFNSCFTIHLFTMYKRRHLFLNRKKFENTTQTRGLEARPTLNLDMINAVPAAENGLSCQPHMLSYFDGMLLTNQIFNNMCKCANGIVVSLNIIKF